MLGSARSASDWAIASHSASDFDGLGSAIVQFHVDRLIHVEHRIAQVVHARVSLVVQ